MLSSRIIMPAATLLVAVALCLLVPLISVDKLSSSSHRSRNLKVKEEEYPLEIAPYELNYNNPELQAGYCHWGPNECNGIAKGGLWCNVDSTNCQTGCGGTWCTSGPPSSVSPYTLSNVLSSTKLYHNTLAILIYDPSSDKFIAHYSKSMRWIHWSCIEMEKSIKEFTHSLRATFPDRFKGDASDEFAVAVSAADYPGLRWSDCIRDGRTNCLPSNPIIGQDGKEVLNEKAPGPILHFGSVLRNPNIIPSMIAMPMPQHNHMGCFHTWATKHEVCREYLPKSQHIHSGLVFGETIGLSRMDELIPQVVWRGTDFGYLHKMIPNLRMPNFEMDIARQIFKQHQQIDEKEKKLAATLAMRKVYNELIPRWKGVVLTAEAERVAEDTSVMNGQVIESIDRRRAQVSSGEEASTVPWANIKFTSALVNGKSTHTSEIEQYQQFEEFGIPAIGDSMNLEELGRYKYHIDLGGGGGTTWSGTLQKLGLPGLLFHHVTPTKDYIHDKMEAWVHYIPVKADLSDLKANFEWAESHPKMAQQISDNATLLARSLGTPNGMEDLFHQFFEEPLKDVIDAYQAVSTRGSGGARWQDVVGGKLLPIMSCSGYDSDDCEIHDEALTERGW